MAKKIGNTEEVRKVNEENGQLRNAIFIKGAREHNLKNIDLSIPRNELIVITGVSGSGKSSVTIDTLYAEGQRRYVESLSSYVRQFLTRINKPDVDYIKGICPAIALDQKVTTRTTRSTVGSLTEIYDYLRLLFARVGKTYSPISGKVVKKDEVSDVVDYLMALSDGKKVFLLVPIGIEANRTFEETAAIYLQKGFARVIVNDTIIKIEDLLLQKKTPKSANNTLFLLVDRIVTQQGNEQLLQRVADSVTTAFYEGHGECIVRIEGGNDQLFSNRFEADGILFEEPNPNFFNQNNPFGACKTCEGFGSIIGIDPQLVIPDQSLSLFQGAVACWRGEKMKLWLEKLVKSSSKFDLPIHKPFYQLTPQQVDLIWQGNTYFDGLNAFFKMVEENAYKIQYRVMLARYRGKTACPDCKGSRVRADANYVKINDYSIAQLLELPIEGLHEFIKNISLNTIEATIANRILIEVNSRVEFMLDLGLGYLTLNRRSNTLSGGETQRINLTRTLGSNLTSSLYILDEPSVGLHPRDTTRLIKVLKRLRDLGNTVVVVEHEEEVIKSADYLIDIGPYAGIHGGEVVFTGKYSQILADERSLTGAYLSERMKIEIPKYKRKQQQTIQIVNARMHNLKNISVTIPLHNLVVVTGVSGSGKTTLIKHILYPELVKLMSEDGDSPKFSKLIEGDIQKITQVELIDQDPIGKSSRSNPVTYVKAYDGIRDLYSKQPTAKARGFKPSHFSFNVDGGRCDTCKGDGEIIVEMQFLADVHLICEDCNGKRFKEEVLEVKYKDKTIADLLELSVEETLEFLKKETEIINKLQPLFDVGLGYIKLGQSSSTLSGGEAQRVKLASFLGKGKSKAHVLFIFDEPTTGLHFHDINKLLDAFHALIDCGHSIIVIEHNMEVIKCSDWIIDLGPEGGEQGGQLIFEGLPESISKIKNSYTGNYLKEKLN